jgi:hypothetical protein
VQNASDVGPSAPSDDRDDSHHSIVCNLLFLIERVRANMRLIESAIAREAPLGNQEIAADVVVLDDVTPRYLKANAALNACNEGLGVAVQFLLDTGTLKHGSGEAERIRQPARSIGRA